MHGLFLDRIEKALQRRRQRHYKKRKQFCYSVYNSKTITYSKLYSWVNNTEHSRDGEDQIGFIFKPRTDPFLLSH
jgi:hypothetical protein